MKVKRLSIKRQQNNKFAIVAKIETKSGFVSEVILNEKPTTSSLKEDFLRLFLDEDELQVEIQYRLLQAV
jgi:hypothetical protein